MNTAKRIAAALFCALLLFSQTGLAADGKTTVTIKNGNYISLGTYMGEPIIWRCVGSDENGTLLISRDILCYKAYAAEYGRWDKSFLRTWLNSADESVSWGESAPDTANTDGNAYADEAGFLAGFSAEELALIKTVSIKSILNVNFFDDANTGSEVHIYNSNGVFSRSIQNYTEGFGIMTEDRVFCLNMKQLETMALNYPSEFICEPRESAVAQSGNAKNEENRSNNYYWLRDCIGNVEFPEAVRCVFPNGRVLFADADDSSIGVRPGIYIDNRIAVIGGNGYEASPYVVSQAGSSAAIGKGSSNEERERLTVYGANASVTEGDYITMGTLYGNEILWRCVDVNENGALMLSEKILGFRAYDAAGSHGNSKRDANGSNNWALSNLRYWLNSSDPEGEKAWPCGNKPNSEKTGGANGYANEQGFLNSFSPEELQYIKTVEIKTIISPVDVDESAVGTEAMVMRRNINNLENYDTAYASYTYDRIFLPSMADVSAIKRNFSEETLAMPTADAVNRNEASIDGLSADRTAAWWTRDADARSNREDSVRTVTQDGWVDSEYAATPSIGVRPAFYLNMETIAFTDGDGSLDTPYRIQSHEYGEWTVSKEAACTERGVRSRVCSLCGHVEEESIPAAGHDFGEATSRRAGLYVIKERVCKSCGEIYTERRLSILPVVIGLVIVAGILAVELIKRKR